MNTAAAATAAQVTPATICRWIRTGKLAARKVSGKWVITETDLRAVIAAPAPAPATEPVVVRPATPARTYRIPTPVETAEAAIRAAYARLARYELDWVLLTRLRAELPAHLTRAEVDAALVRLERGDVHLVPEADQKLLTGADRAAAVLVGGVAKHLVAIEG